MTTSRDPLQEAARMSRSAVQLRGTATERAREIARALLDVRLAHSLPDGRPDLAGTTRAYRVAVSKMYAQTGVTGEDLRQLKDRVRYHLANLVHEYMAREGIDPATYALQPRGRKEAIRDSMRRSRAGITGDDDPGAVALAALAEAVACLTVATSPEALAALGHMGVAERAQAERALARIQDAAGLANSAL